MRRYRIGRADTNDVVLGDTTVSREHAELNELGDGRFQVKDLGSTFGLFVWEGQDWKKVTEAELRSDSRLRIGEYQTTVAELLHDTDKTVVRGRIAEPTAAPPSPARTAAPPPPARTATPSESDRTEPPAMPRPAPPRPAPPQPAPPRPAPPRPAPPRPPRPAESDGTAAPQNAPPVAPAAPAFQFLRNLPPEKRILLWLGAGFAGFLLISLITLILALVL